MSSLPFPSQLPWLSRNWPVPACTSSILILDGEDHKPVGVVSEEGLLGEVCHGLLAVCDVLLDSLDNTGIFFVD